jgi:hypothetical protein
MDLSGFCWGAIDLLVLTATVTDFALASALADFGAGPQTPLDLCDDLNRKVAPYLTVEGAICVLALCEMKRAWPLFCVHFAVVCYWLGRMHFPSDARRRKRRVGSRKAYDPLTVVRDIGRLVRVHVAIGFFESLSAVYAIVRSLFVWVGHSPASSGG